MLDSNVRVGLQTTRVRPRKFQSYEPIPNNDKTMKINRRTMLAALVAGSSASLLAQEPTKSDPTLYIPRTHRVEDLKLLQDFIGAVHDASWYAGHLGDMNSETVFASAFGELAKE